MTLPRAQGEADSPSPSTADAAPSSPLKERGKFHGYAALFDRVDRAGDVFRAGAFAAGEVPLLRDHRGPAIGTVTVHEDARGLLVEGAGGRRARGRRAVGRDSGQCGRAKAGGARSFAPCWSRSAWWRCRCSRARG